MFSSYITLKGDEEMTLQQLNYVIKISETNSFNKAAEELRKESKEFLYGKPKTLKL